MKNKKRKTVIITLFSLFCLCGIIFTAIIASHNNQTDKYTLENTYNTYLKSDNATVAIVDNTEITNKQLKLIQYSYKTSKPLDTAIKQTAIVRLAKADGFSLSESDLKKETDYIGKAYKELNIPESEENIAFKNDLEKNHLEMALSIKYQSHIKEQIFNQKFYCDDEEINKSYEKYKAVYKDWTDGGKNNSALYKRAYNQREKIVQDYIDYRIARLEITKC